MNVVKVRSQRKGKSVQDVAKGEPERQAEKVSAFSERSIGREPQIRLASDSLTRIHLSLNMMKYSA